MARSMTPVRRLTYGVGMAAAVGAAVSQRLEGDRPPPPTGALLALLAALTVAGCLRLRFHYSDERLTLDAFDAILMAAVFALPGWAVVVLAGVAKGTAQGIRRVHVTKAAFNIAQWMATAAAASTCYDLLRDGRELTTRNVGALVAATLVGGVVNHCTVIAVLSVAGDTPPRAVLSRLSSVVVPGWVVGGMLNGAFGLLLTTAYSRSTWAVGLFFVPLGMLHWASHGYAAARADRARLAGLQRATHTLVALDPRDGFPRLLDEVRACFEVEAAELVLFDGERRRVYRSEAGVATDGATYGRTDERGTERGLPDLLARRPGAVRVDAEEVDEEICAALTRADRRDCLAAPLRSGERTLGVLCAYNRIGMEGFEQGELAVAEALASEIVAALEKADLVESVLEERRRLAEIVGQTSDGIATISADGTIRSWNPGMETISGHPASEMVGGRVLARLRTADALGREVPIDRWVEHRPLPDRVQITTAAGERRWLSCSFNTVPAADGAPDSLIVIARDITEAHQLEQLKDDFVAIVSHELRTPVTPIKGWAHILLKHGHRLDADRQRDAAQNILAQSHRLEQLIANVLEAYRMENDRRPAIDSVVDVGATVLKVVEEHGVIAPEATIRLDCGLAGCDAYGEAAWVERIVANLISNAIKYAPRGEPIDARVVSDDETIAVQVSDRGPGIPRQDRDRVFERFERLTESHTQTGTGLGLYIARQLAERMGGTVEVDTRPGLGCTFSLVLRRAGCPAGSVPS